MKKALVSGILLVFSIVTTFVACNRNENIQPAQSSAENSMARDAAFTQFGKMLAASMEATEMKEFLKEQAVAQFDGDYDILFAKARTQLLNPKQKSIKTGTNTFEQFLIDQEVNRSARSNAKSLKEFLDELQKKYPLLQISIPEVDGTNADQWDIYKHTPLVAVIPSDYDEVTTKTVPAYDAKGNVYNLDAQNPPQQVVIVINENERVVTVANSGAKKSSPSGLSPYMSDKQYDYYLANTYYDTMDKKLYQSARQRDTDPDKDELKKFRFVSMNALKTAEGWLSGKFEMKVIVAIGGKSVDQFQTLTKRFDRTRDQLRGGCNWFGGNCSVRWSNINLEILTWKESEYGNRMKYIWYEHDGGGAREVTTSFSTGFTDPTTKVTTTVGTSIKYTITSEDTQLGESFVEYADPSQGDGTLYNAGRVDFYVGQR